MSTRDAYSKAIRYFRAHPQAWNTSWGHKYGYLFSFLNYSRFYNNNNIGCPSLIKYDIKSGNKCPSQKLIELCKNADLPNLLDCKCNENVDVVPKLKNFAKIQRIADKKLNRPAPQQGKVNYL